MRTQRRSNTIPLLVAATLLGGALQGCNGDDPNGVDPACENEKQPDILPVSLNVPQRGTVLIRDLLNHTKDSSTETGLVQAKFADFRTVTSTPSDLTSLSEFCVGTVSKPQQSGIPTPLAMDSLSISGTGRGVITLMQAMTGTTTREGVFSDSGAVLLDNNNADIQIVAMNQATGGFPAFDVTIPGISPMNLVMPPPDGTGKVVVDEQSIEWTPGNGDFVLLRFTPDDPADNFTSGGQVTCAVVDDGCFVFSAAAGAFLLASQATTYTLAASRHRYVALAPSAASFLEIELMSEWRTTMVNGETR